MADTGRKSDNINKILDMSYDLSLESIYSEYPPGCIPIKLKIPSGEKAKRAKFESLDLELYEDKANMVACRVSSDRMFLWIKALHTYYYEHLGNIEEFDINWSDDPLDWKTNVESTKGNKAICIDVSKQVQDMGTPLLYKITLFINTGVLQAQGNAKDHFAKNDFPILVTLVDKIKEFNVDRVAPDNIPCPVKEGTGLDINSVDSINKVTDLQEKTDSEQTNLKQTIEIEESAVVTQFRPEKMMERMESCFLQALDKICTKQSDLFTAKLKTMEDSYLHHLKENTDKLTKVLESITKLQTSKPESSACDQKLMNKLNSFEHENSDLKMCLQQVKHETEMEKIQLQAKLDQQCHQNDLHKQSYNNTVKQLKSEIDTLGIKVHEKDDKLESLENSCKELKLKIEEKDDEIYSLKQQVGKDENTGEFQEVRYRGADRQSKTKPHVVLIGTSNTNRIDVSKMSAKYTVEKQVAYMFSDTETSLRNIGRAPEVIAFHSLTNELCEKNAEVCVNKMKEIINLSDELYPSSKIVLSVPTPRADSESFNAKGQLISALLKQEYLNSEKVFICEHGNLANKGRAILRFLSEEDKFHLSEQGANVFAANLRDTIDEVLNLPKRVISPYQNDSYNGRRGGYRGRGYRGQRYRGYQSRGRRY